MRNFLFLFACLFFTGCWRPFHEPLLVDIQTSEVAILVETVNDNGQAIIGPNNDSNNSETDFFRKRLVNARKVQIPYYWKQTHRAWLWQDFTTGKWTSAARLIVVDTQPETREWSEDSEAIWVESKDSIGFSTGISITARIDNKEDAVKFLSNYPPKNIREITTSGGDPFSVEIASLEQIMDKEVRTKIQEVFADEAASFDMDELRGRKKEVMSNIRELVVPYSPVFGNWSFTYKRNKGLQVWDCIPKDCDVIFTHTMPKGILDLALDFDTHEIIQVGCKSLYNKIMQTKASYFFGGHLHSTKQLHNNGILKHKGKTFVNAACLNHETGEILQGHTIQI